MTEGQVTQELANIPRTESSGIVVGQKARLYVWAPSRRVTLDQPGSQAHGGEWSHDPWTETEQILIFRTVVGSLLPNKSMETREEFHSPLRTEMSVKYLPTTISSMPRQQVWLVDSG